MPKMRNDQKILSNGMFFAGYKLLNVLFPLITSVYVARVLLPDGTGRVAYAQNIVTYFTLIAALGLPTYGTREIAKYIDDEKKYNQIFFELYIINAISTTFCVLGYYSLCLFIPRFRADIKLYLVAGIAIILNYFNVDWLYQGREEYKYISIRGVVVKSISVIMLFAFVKDVSDYVVYAAIYCFVLGGNYFANIVGLRKRIVFSKYSLRFRRHWKPLLVLFATTVAIELYTMLDTTMLGILCSNKIVGYYSYAMKTSKILITILAAATAVLLPKLSNYYLYNRNRYVKLANKGLAFILSSSIPLSTLLFVCSKDVIILLYGNEYMGAVNTLNILSILIVPISLSTFLGTQILCSANMERKMLVAVCCGAITNIILNAILIPVCEHNGAAIASVISEIIVAIVDFYFVQKYINLSLKFKFVFTLIVADILLFFSVLWISKIVHILFFRLLLSGVVGISTFLLIFLFVYFKSIPKSFF